jgi:hypothetical protein
MKSTDYGVRLSRTGRRYTKHIPRPTAIPRQRGGDSAKKSEYFVPAENLVADHGDRC